MTEVVLRHGRMVVKGKSMAAEEIGLNEHLEAAGVEVVETDLGEFIVQTAGERPSTSSSRRSTRPRTRCASLFEPLAGARRSGTTRPTSTAFARDHLREPVPRGADVGITGVNFAVAETGTIVLVTNEGNGRICRRCRAVHIAVMGDRAGRRASSPTSAVLLPLLARSGTGQKLTIYVTLLTARGGASEPDGPEEMHVVILDNGRSRVRGTRLHRRSSTASAAAPARTSARSTARSAATPTAGSTAARSAPC